jgi:hypothetical protein
VEFAGRQIPHKVEVRHGDVVYADITWSKIGLTAAKGAPQ